MLGGSCCSLAKLACGEKVNLVLRGRCDELEARATGIGLSKRKFHSVLPFGLLCPGAGGHGVNGVFQTPKARSTKAVT